MQELMEQLLPSIAHAMEDRPRNGWMLPMKIKLHVSTAAVQLLYSGFQVLTREAVSGGTNFYIFPFYRNAIAVLLVAPVAYFLERKKRPALTFVKLMQFFSCGFVGVCINQILFVAGVYYTSANFSSTIQNLIPAFTFSLAALLRTEKLHIRRRDGQAKILGSLVCLCGAMVITLYNGPALINATELSIKQDNTSMRNLQIVESNLQEFKSWRLGVLCLIGNCATWAIWFVSQVPLLRNYPAEVSATAFTLGFGTIQSLLLAACFERDLSTWLKTLENDYIAILYGGIVASGIAMSLQSWCAHKGGPVLVAAYQPLQTILVVVLSSVILRETFYVGSVVGGLLIIIGLYFVVWGKSKEGNFTGITEAIDKGSQDSSYLVADSTLTEPFLGFTPSMNSSDLP